MLPGTGNIAMITTDPYGRQILNDRTNDYGSLIINATKGKYRMLEKQLTEILIICVQVRGRTERSIKGNPSPLKIQFMEDLKDEWES